MSAAVTTSRLAVDGGTPVRTAGWPGWPQPTAAEWRETVEPALREVYLSAVEGLPGPRAAAFARSWAEFCGAEWGIMTPHGTDALMAALAGVLDADGLAEVGEIIMPAYTFIATASAALALRARVVFADIDPHTYTLDPAAVAAAITPQTVAIMPVHIGGQAADLEALSALAAKHGLALVEDCAQAHGAAWQHRRVGSWGDAGGFSFQSSKNLTAGEGGCITTRDKAIYERIVSFLDVGRRPGGERWEYPRLGWNYRPSEYLAALLATRLPRYESQLLRRARNADYLSGQLAGVPGLSGPTTAAGCTQHAYHMFMMTYDPAAFGGRSRDEFAHAMGAEGIPAWVGYTAGLDKHDALMCAAERYPGLVRCGDLSVTQNVCDHSLWLGQAILLAEPSDLDDIVTAAARIQAAWAG